MRTKDWQVVKAKEDYTLRHEIPFPHFNRLAGRPVKPSPMYERLKEKGAVFEEVYGHERPRWFAGDGVEQRDHYSFRRNEVHDRVAKECDAVRSRVGIMDITTFAKIEVSGPGAEALLERLIPNTLPTKTGGVILTHLLNRRGRIEIELTIVRLEESRFYLMCAAFYEQRLLDHLKQQKADENAEIRNLSDDWSALSLQGPYSRDVLAATTDAALDNASFRWLILLGPGAELDLRLSNVQLELYAAFEQEVWLNVWQVWPEGGRSVVQTRRLDERLEQEGLRIEGIEPGDLLVEVKLGGVFSAEDVPVLGGEKLTLGPGEARELVLALAEPPVPPERATLAGVVSIPTFGGEEKVRLQVYSQDSSHRSPEVELTLAELEPVGGARPTWSFRVEDLEVGLYRVQLLPFVKAVMIELPAEGCEDVELIVPELAEVQVETVDGRTGERVPLEEFYYRHLEPPPGLERNDWARADTEEPGRFRFWTVPGAVSIYPRSQDERGYGLRWEEHRLVPGFQSLRFELPPLHGMHFEFREDGSTLPVGDPGMFVTKNIRAVGHDGRVTGDGLQTDRIVEVSAPGVYELHFDGIDTERYHPLPPRQVEVREGEVVKVIVDLRLR